MREFHEVRKRLGERPEASSPYVLYARKLLAELKLDMSRNGLLQGVRRRQVDGVLVEVSSVFGQDQINIIPPMIPAGVPRKKREKEIVRPRWIFCTPAIYSNTYIGPAGVGTIYIHDWPSAEPRKLADFESFGVGSLLAQYAGSFDWKRRMLAVAWYTDYQNVGCAYIDPLSGAVLFSSSFAGADWMQSVCAYDGVVYVLHGGTATIHIVSSDLDEEVDISGTIDWASWMFISGDGRYLVLCAGEQDVAPPYRVHVFDIESRTFVGAPYLREYRLDFDTIDYAWDQESDALYLFHNYGGEPGSTTTMTRINLVDGGLEPLYEVGLRSGQVYSVSADTKAVCASSHNGYTSEPGIVQFMDPETGAIDATYAEPEAVGSNWPIYLVSDRHGAVYSHSTPGSDNDTRMTRIKAGELRWASRGSFIPMTYGEGFEAENDLGETQVSG